MAGGTTIDGGPMGLVINEVLCFIMNKWGNIDTNVLMRLCVGKYKDDQIENAKDVLFGYLHNENDSAEYIKRRASRKPDSKSKKEKNLEDIFKILEEKGDADIPDFVAKDLYNLPPVTFDSMDVSIMYRKADNIQCELDLIKETLNKMTESYTGICEVLKRVTNELGEVKAAHKRCKLPDENKSPEQSVKECEKVIDDFADELSHVCPDCDVRFMAFEGLIEHIKKEHSCKPFQCDICDESFIFEKDLITHVDGHTKKRQDDLSLRSRLQAHDYEDEHSELEKQMQGLTITGKNTFKCDKCEYEDLNEENLKVHMVKHKGEKPYKCDKCEYEDLNEENLKAHMEKHKGEKPYKCDKCDFNDPNEVNLKLHMETHRGENPYKCDKCEFRFYTRKNLELHMNVHKGEKPFKCDKCAFSHVNKENLKLHMQVHRNETPNLDSAAEFPLLDNVTKGHASHKPYVCHKCDSRFNSQEDCKKHMLKHKVDGKDVINACYVCDRKYTNINELKRHIKTHTGEKPFRCRDCDYECDDAAILKLHMKDHIGENNNGKQHIIDSLTDNEGWSMPFLNGKPMKRKNSLKPNQHEQKTNNSPIIGTGRGASQAIENKKDQAVLFASRFRPNSNAATVKKDLESNLLRITGISHIVTVEKRPTRYDHYASYKISCFCDNKSVFLNPEVWPSDIIVRWWQHQRYGRNSRQENNYNNNNYKYKGSRSYSITGHGY